MKCPVCPDSTLSMLDRQGVEIDYCPHCRGVWLDRGELEKLMERAGSLPAASSVPLPAPAPSPVPVPASHYGMRPPRDFADSDYAQHRQGGYGQRKKSWLSEIFD